MSTTGRWRHFVARLPMRTALTAVAVVWLLGCVWSFQEQSAFAAAKGFAFPHLLPLVIDGFAVSMAGVSWAASLDARPAIPARLATVVAVGASSASNGVWAYLRTNHDTVTVVLGVAVPTVANLAFEVLLAELRRQVQRRRGLPAPVAVPYPRVIRAVLAPVSTFRIWRMLVLELTALHQPNQVERFGVRSTEPGAAAQLATAELDVTERSRRGVSTEVMAAPALLVTNEPVDQFDQHAVAVDALIGAEADAYEAELADRARVLVEGSPFPVGRRRLARELDITEYQARVLLDRITDRAPAASVE
ncbi:MAG TPA: DUF2637 domain-containing protein [Pseudonocardia sp.]